MKTIPTPKEYCDAYIRRVYDEGPLNMEQGIEVMLAFHAGIEAMCRFMMEDFFSEDNESDDTLQDRLVTFRRTNKERALHINMTRFVEGQNEKNN